MKLFNKQNLTKIVMASALILPISSLSAHGVQAAIVPNTKTICHVNKATKVYDDYKKGKHATGQVLGANTSWKIIKTAKTKKGVTWYDLGKNQWIKAPKLTYTAQVVNTQAPVSQAPQAPTQNTQTNQIQAQAPTQNTQTYQVQVQMQPTQQQLTQISSNAVQATTQIKHQKTYTTNSNNSANYIASRESGGSYSARNGQYIGKYQLSASYLHGDYSPANQERVARQYAISRYGSWQAAANFHRTHGWW